LVEGGGYFDVEEVLCAREWEGAGAEEEGEGGEGT